MQSLREALDAAATVRDREYIAALDKRESQLRRAGWLWEDAHAARRKWDIPMTTLIRQNKVDEYAKAMEQADAWAQKSTEIRKRADAEKQAAMAAADKKHDAACAEARKLYK